MLAMAAMPVNAQSATATLGNFTPSGTASDLTKATESERRFAFTPAGRNGDAAGRKGVSVGVTSRIVNDAGTAPATAPVQVLAARPVASAGAREVETSVDVGYRGFSLSGGVSRAADSLSGTGREGAEVGVGYAGKRWRAGIEAGASDKADDKRLLPDSIGAEEHVELGGAYLVSPRLSVRGGVRYDRLRPEAFGRDFVNRDEEKARESGTVYLGTSFSF